MLNRNLVRFGLALLFAVIGSTAGCKSVPQPPQVATANGLRVDVEKVSPSGRKQRIDIRIVVWNDLEQRVTFDLANVRLDFKGREVSAKPLRQVDALCDVQPKSNREFRWYFEVGDTLTEGYYDISIRNMMLGDVPHMDVAQFKINVAP